MKSFAPWVLSWNQCRSSQGEKAVRDRLFLEKKGEERKDGLECPEAPVANESGAAELCL